MYVYENKKNNSTKYQYFELIGCSVERIATQDIRIVKPMQFSCYIHVQTERQIHMYV